jgi:prepilin-type N-terminal cleavage/methylation domain-containing protein
MMGASNATRRDRRHRGLTLVEMMMGLALLGLIGAANAAVLFAVGRAWTSAETDRANRTGGYQASAFMYRQLRAARYVGVAHGGMTDVATGTPLPPALAIWREDDVLEDGIVQYGEYAVIEYDALARTVKMYYHPVYEPGAADRVPDASLNSAVHAAEFKDRPYVEGRLVARDVKEAKFKAYAVNGNAQARLVEFTFVIERDGREQVEYGTATVRSPKKPQGAAAAAQ